MNLLSRNTGLFLKYGIYAAVLILVAGVARSFVDADIGSTVSTFGLYVLVFVPFLSIIVSTHALYKERDMYWFKVALILILITTVGMVFAYMA